MTESSNHLDFVHLHVHSEYSLIDGSIRTGKAIAKAKSWGQKAIAITDSGNLFGAVEFYGKAKAEGIKAIIGSEIYFEGHPSTLRYAEEAKHTWPEVGAFHLLFLCRNNDGYRKLCKIVSTGYTQGLKEIPVVKCKDLLQNAGDLIALSSDLHSELAYLLREFRLLQGPGSALDFSEAGTDRKQLLVTAIEAHVKAMHSYVGEGNYYIELIDNQLPVQKILNEDLVACAKHFHLPLVCSADAHYLDESFTLAHSVFVAIKSSLTFKDLRHRNRQARFHLLSPDEIQTTFGKWPEAIQNTVKIASECNVSFEFGKYYLPKFPVPPGMTADDYMETLSKDMLEERLTFLAASYGPTFDEARQTVYRDRLAYELSVIRKMGFAGYFLIVQDFINWAKENGIPVGPGRGSGAGSLVAYALRITDLDPLRFNLLFERFLNPERISMPDFDVDFCQDRRGEVIDYVTKKYGKDNVAQIATFGKMKAKLCVRDVARVMEVSYGRADKIAKLIPNKVPNEKGEEVEATIPLAMKAEPRLQEEADKDTSIAQVLEITAQLEGLNRQTGTHAAGVVMSDGAMTNYVPVFTTEDGALITQFEMKNAEKVGLVKFDFLGLKTLTVIDAAVKLVRAHKDPAFNIDLIDLEDPKVYKEISAAHSVGVFQLEGEGMQNLLLKLKPSSFEDVIAVVALFRPGPLGSGMVDDFIERKHGRQQIKYPHPALEDILRETYGVILYQEQVQKTAVVLANYSPGEADLLRRAMGKKIKSEMDAQKARFLRGAEDNKIDPALAEEIFDLMAKFAEYGFNKSHSAAYGLVSYQTAYLKAHFPDLFMAAIMTCDLDRTDKVVRYAEDCVRMGIKLGAPSINTCQLQFSVPKPMTITWGLAAVKGIGAAAAEPVIKERSHGPYTSIADLAKRVRLQDVGKKTLELLTKVGAFDEFGIRRSLLLSQIAELVKFSEQLHTAKTSSQRSLFDSLETEEFPDHTPAAWLKGLSDPYKPNCDELADEKKLLGIYLTGHPLDFFKKDILKFSQSSLGDIQKIAGKPPTPVVAILSNVELRRGKDGRPLAYVTLEDAKTSIEAMMFDKNIPPNGAFPPSGSPVVAICQIRKRHDGSFGRLSIERIVPLEEVRTQMVKSVALNIAGDTSDLEEHLTAFANLAKSCRGHQELRISLKFKHGSVAFKTPHGIEASDKFILASKSIAAVDLEY